MLELQGKYNKCKVFTDEVDSSTIGQLIALMNQESTSESQIRIMPDCHAGKGSTIGTTMTITDKIIPNIVGVDIGCSVLCIQLKEKRIDLPKLDSIINKFVPSGIKVHNESKENRTSVNLEDLYCFRAFANKENYIYCSVGSLGSWNHFLEIDKDEDDNLYLVIHSGSRNLGVQVCEYYQKKGFRLLKEQGSNVPFELAYVEGELFEQYIHDMKLTQKFAEDNRAEIARIIMKQAKLHELDRFDTKHNYIDTDSMILRKGAVSAKEGERLIIPMNMRDGALICTGKGNPDWNYSAPHGAGRLLSRSEAKESIGMTEFKESMKGIFTTSVCTSTIDESPMAYKSMNDIIPKIGDTVEIVKTIKPIYNFKAHSN